MEKLAPSAKASSTPCGRPGEYHGSIWSERAYHGPLLNDRADGSLHHRSAGSAGLTL